MHGFDQLDWVHQWDNYEMVMYVDRDDHGNDAIFMQVLVKQEDAGAEAWDILYDRVVSIVDYTVEASPDNDAWQDQILRHYLNAHPTLVPDEKVAVEKFVRGDGEPENCL